MASRIVNRGLQVIAGRASSTADGFAAIQSMAVDDDSNAFGQTDDSLDDAGGGAPANVAAKNFDATPTRSAQTVTHTSTYGTGEGNFTIRRISLHNALEGSVSGTSVTLVGGIDGQSITKTSNFTLTLTVQITYTDNS